MCGIIGYTGTDGAVKKVTKGLEILEYRGYDSVGICACSNGKLEIAKAKGRVSELKRILSGEPRENALCAIGHTRWATHGAPSYVNAHPHRVGKTCIVHNGIIENYKEIKSRLEGEGINFVSDTDTEVGCGLINYYYEKTKDPYNAILSASAEMRGSYALAIMLEDEKNTIYAIRQGSPLIIAKGKDGFYLASDLTALIPFTKEYYPLNEGELVRLTENEAVIYQGGKPQWKITDMSFEAAKKGGYDHFMLKEMYEQPEAIKGSLTSRIVNGLPDFSSDGLDKSFFEKIKEIHIVACGSAMHAGLVAACLIEKSSLVPTSVYIASEYRYNPPITREGTLVIVVSQSGETADSLASLRHAKERGLTTLGIVNAVETTIAREADFRAYTYAGPEIAVATTKGYATQVSLLGLFAICLAYNKGEIDEKNAKALTECLFFEAPAVMENVLIRRAQLKEIAKQIYERDDIFYIGRGIDYAMSREASLKLKEISYIHSQAYAAGELKHGTISLIEDGTPVIAIATQEALFDKMDSNIKEVRARGAKTILICHEKMQNTKECADIVFKLPKGSYFGNIFSSLMAVQLIAYETALLRECDIDKPKNLAKSVTVE